MPKTKYYNLMKKLLNWVVLAVLMLAIGVPMVSCDDDNDPQYPTVTEDSLAGTWKRGSDDKSYVFTTVVKPEDKKLMTGGRWVELEQEGLVTVKELVFEGNKVTAKVGNTEYPGDYAIKNGIVSMNIPDVLNQQFGAEFRGMDSNNVGFSYKSMGTIKQRVFAEDGKTQVEEVVAVVEVKVTVHYDRSK